MAGVFNPFAPTAHSVYQQIAILGSSVVEKSVSLLGVPVKLSGTLGHWDVDTAGE